MVNNDFTNLGEQIRATVQSAVDSKDFEKLDQVISKAMNNVKSELQSAQNLIKESKATVINHIPISRKSTSSQQTTFSRNNNTVIRHRPQELFSDTTGTQAGGWALAILGYTFGFGLGLVTLILALTGLFADGIFAVLVFLIIMSIPLGGTLFAGIKGTTMLKRVSRFKRYIGVLGSRTYGKIEQMAYAVGKPVSFVQKDLRKMITSRWFKQGYIDDDGIHLIATHQTYKEYRQTQDHLLAEKARHKQIQAEYASLPNDARAIIQEGNEYIQKIRQKSEVISEEEMTTKLIEIKVLIQKIFKRVEHHPEIIPDLRKMMQYYLPTTIKLLDAYEQLDLQPIEGANIVNAKAEIEDTLDTLIVAFEKLLDKLFQDVAWDISSDIAVLHTMLAQEGLTKADFEKVEEE